MSNAIVEAYIMEGSLLYATTYTNAGMQNSSIPTYVPNAHVMSLMDADQKIVALATSALRDRYTDRARNQRNDVINPAINSFTENALQNVETNVAEEIEKQKAARMQYVDGLSAY